MKTYQIDFECHWDTKDYPVPVSFGTFTYEANDKVEVAAMIYKRFIWQKGLLANYCFIISSDEECFKISSGEF